MVLLDDVDKSLKYFMCLRRKYNKLLAFACRPDRVRLCLNHVDVEIKRLELLKLERVRKLFKGEKKKLSEVDV